MQSSQPLTPHFLTISFLEKSSSAQIRQHYDLVWAILPDVVKTPEKYSQTLIANILCAVFSNFEEENLAPFPSFLTLYQCLLLSKHHLAYSHYITEHLKSRDSLLLFIRSRLVVESQKNFCRYLPALYNDVFRSDEVLRRFTHHLFNDHTCSEKIWSRGQFMRRINLLAPHAHPEFIEKRLDQILNFPSLKSHPEMLILILETQSPEVVEKLCVALLTKNTVIRKFCSSSYSFLQVIQALLKHKQFITAQRVLRYTLEPDYSIIKDIITKKINVEHMINQLVAWYRLIKKAFPFLLEEFYENCAKKILLAEFIRSPQESLHAITVHLNLHHQNEITALIVDYYGIAVTPYCDLLFHCHTTQANNLLKKLLAQQGISCTQDINIETLISYTAQRDAKNLSHEWYFSYDSQYFNVTQQLVFSLCKSTDQAISWVTAIPQTFRLQWLIWLLKNCSHEIISQGNNLSTWARLHEAFNALQTEQLALILKSQPDAAPIAILLGLTTEKFDALKKVFNSTQIEKISQALCNNFPAITKNINSVDKNWLWYFLYQHIDKIFQHLNMHTLNAECVYLLQEAIKNNFLQALETKYMPELILVMVQLKLAPTDKLAFLMNHISAQDYKKLFELLQQNLSKEDCVLALQALHSNISNETLYMLIQNSVRNFSLTTYLLLIKLILQTKKDFLVSDENFNTLFSHQKFLNAIQLDPIIRDYFVQRQPLTQPYPQSTENSSSSQRELTVAQDEQEILDLANTLLDNQSPLDSTLFSLLGKRKFESDMSNAEKLSP